MGKHAAKLTKAELKALEGRKLAKGGYIGKHRKADLPKGKARGPAPKAKGPTYWWELG